MVPKVLHQITGPGVNEVIRFCFHSWKIIEQKGFKIRSWDDDKLENFISKKYPFALQPFVNARNHAEASDIARYLIIFHFGGIYMDWDVQLLDPEKFVRLFRDTPNGFLLQDPPNQTIASEAFSAPANEKYLLDLVNDIVGIYHKGERDAMLTPQYSGPYRMRDALKNSKTKQAILPVKQVFAYDYSEIREMPERPITQPLIHYWVHSWMGRKHAP